MPLLCFSKCIRTVRSLSEKEIPKRLKEKKPLGKIKNCVKSSEMQLSEKNKFMHVKYENTILCNVNMFLAHLQKIP